MKINLAELRINRSLGNNFLRTGGLTEKKQKTYLYKNIKQEAYNMARLLDIICLSFFFVKL